MTARLRRCESVVATVAVLLASSALLTFRWRSVERTRTTVVVQTALPIRLAADDCPLGVTCIDGSPRPILGRLLRQYLPGAQVLDESATSGSDSARPYREVVHARTSDGVDVQLTVRRVPGGAAVPVTPPGTAPATPAFGPATVAIVVPGEAGESIAVVLDVPAGARVPIAAAERLVHERRLRLRN